MHLTFRLPILTLILLVISFVVCSSHLIILLDSLFCKQFGNSVNPDQLASAVHSFQNRILVHIQGIQIKHGKV